MVLNLLTNAAKYTPSKDKINLSDEQLDGQVIIRVRDNSLGISAETLPHVFELFSQVDPASSQSCNGLGIGLGMMKKLVEMHGGSVSVSSEGLGKGSEFAVRLPLVQPGVAASPEDKKPRGDTAKMEEIKPAKKKVLIVDDNADVLQMIQSLLTMDGHEVRTAPDGESALLATRTAFPSLTSAACRSGRERRRK